MVLLQGLRLLVLLLPVLLALPIASNDPNADSKESDDEKFRQPFAAIYNDEEARYLWKVTSSAYLVRSPSAVYKKCLFDELNFSTVPGITTDVLGYCTQFSDTICAYVFGVDHRAKIIYIAGQGLGSENFCEFYRDRRRPKKQFKDLLVHETAYDYFWNDENAREAWADRHFLYPDYRLVVTGHQTAGLVAQLIAYDVVTSGQLPSSKVMVRTFGAPKGMAWGNYTDIYMKAVPNTFHITQRGDDVPRQPLLGYHLVDKHLKEIYYKQGMAKGAKYTICKGKGDPDCSQGDDNENSTVAANDVYFGQHWSTACFADD